MLLDEVLPQFDFTEHHSIEIAAPKAVVWRALHETDFARPFVVRLLMGLRVLPSLLRGERKPRVQRMTLSALDQSGFHTLRTSPPDETVLGVVGEFWKLRGNISDVDARSFMTAHDEIRARAAWNFRLEDAGTKTRLSTETRIQCPNAKTRRRFGRYWLFVRPFSGLIRIVLLREVRRVAVREAS